MKTALLVYSLKTGNTEKVANAIKQGLEESRHTSHNEEA